VEQVFLFRLGQLLKMKKKLELQKMAAQMPLFWEIVQLTLKLLPIIPMVIML
jgi:hypothetical protein